MKKIMTHIIFSIFLCYTNQIFADTEISTVTETTTTTAPSSGVVETLPQTTKNGGLSFNFQNIDIRTLLQIIAKSSGMNFVISDAVKGSMTMSMKNVTWQEALNTVLKTHNLTMKRVGNVIYITTAEEMTASLTKQLQNQQVLEGLEPLKSQLVRLKYSDVTLMANLLKGPQGSTLLSARGQVGIDPRTNSLIIIDTEKHLARVRKTLASLDIPAKQVLIEARIVNMDTTFEKQLGVRFGINDAHHLAGTLGGANQLQQGIDPAFITPIDQRLNFDLPANALSTGAVPASIAIALSRLGPILLDLELSALEAEGHVQIISKPRVVTSNQQKAIIETGEEIPYQEATSSGATSISFKKAVLSLEVVPLITPNNKILLKLKVTQDTRGPQLVISPGSTSTTTTSVTTTPAVFGPPTINTQQVESYILLNDNETFVVGGVYKINTSYTINRIPFFGSLPVIGGLFRQRGESNDKSELLIFITPKIIHKGCTV